jgi:protein-tyrosine phosphatase
MVRAELYPITDCPAGRLALMPRPRAGDWLEDEAQSWRRQGLDVVVSLLEDSEVDELGLADEAKACERAALRFVRFPIPDRGVPASEAAASDLVSALAAELRAGRGVGIHCRIGVGRSASLAVCVLAALGVAVEAAWVSVQRSRGLSVPDTPAQRAWVAGWFAGFRSSAANSGEQAAAADAGPLRSFET